MIIQNIPVEVERKFIRTMRLSVRADGRVHLSVPFFVTAAHAEAFVRSKWEWVCRTRERVLSRPKEEPYQYISGEEHWLFGARYTLVVEHVTSGTHSVSVEGNELHMRCRPSTSRDSRRALLHAFYRAQLIPVLTQMVNDWTMQLNEADVTWAVRLMRSEWGSCRARKRHLMFNLALACVPENCIEYIVVHELTHLKVQNHGAAFKSLMTQRLSDWKSTRKQLNSYFLKKIFA